MYQTKWPTWLKLEHSGKMQFLLYIFETKTFRAIFQDFNVHQNKIYPLTNFQLNRTTCCWVAAPELVILRKFHRFWLLSVNSNNVQQSKIYKKINMTKMVS